MPSVRRPAVWLVAGAMAGGMLLSLAGRDWPWLGDPLWGQELVGVAQVLVLPIAAGALAVVGWRDRGSYFTLVTAGRQQARHVMWTIGSWVLALAMAYLVVNSGVVIASRFVEPSLPDATVMPVLTQVAGMFVAAAVGYASGFWLDSWAGTLVAAVVIAVTITFDRLGSVTSGFAEYAANGLMLGATPNVSYFATRLSWLVSIGVTVLATVVVTGRRRQLAVGAVLVLVLAATMLFRTNHSYSFAEEPLDYCAGDTVRVCGPVPLATRVRQAASIAGEVASALDDLGVTHVSKLEAWGPRSRGADWVLLVNADRFRDPLDPGEVISAMASPTSCPVWTSTEPPPDEWFAADAFVRSYLAAATGRDGASSYGKLVQRMGVDKAQTVIRDAARALESCDPRLVPPGLRG